MPTADDVLVFRRRSFSDLRKNTLHHNYILYLPIPIAL